MIGFVGRAPTKKPAHLDAIFAICWTTEHASFFRNQVSGPMMTIRTLGTEINVDRVQYSSDMMALSVDELYDLGYQLQIEPTTMLGVAVNAMVEAMTLEKQTGKMSSLASRHGNLYELLDLWMNVPEVRRIRETYVRAEASEGGSACGPRKIGHVAGTLDDRHQGGRPRA